MRTSSRLTSTVILLIGLSVPCLALGSASHSAPFRSDNPQEEVPPEVTENLNVDLGLLNLSSFANAPNLTFEVAEADKDKDKWGPYPTWVTIKNNGTRSVFIGNGIPPTDSEYKDNRKDVLPLVGKLIGPSDSETNWEIKPGASEHIEIAYNIYKDPKLTYRHVWGLYLRVRYHKAKAPAKQDSNSQAKIQDKADAGDAGNESLGLLRKTMGMLVSWRIDKSVTTGSEQVTFPSAAQLVHRRFVNDECVQMETIPLKQVVDLTCDSQFNFTFIVDHKLTPEEFAQLPESLKSGLPADILNSMVAKDGDMITIVQSDKGKKTNTTASQFTVCLPGEGQIRNMSLYSLIYTVKPRSYTPEEYRQLFDALKSLVKSAKAPTDKPCEFKFLNETVQ